MPPDVCLIKLVPGTKPELLAAVKTLGYRGVVIEGFGAGGVPFTGRNLVPKIEELLQAGIAVVITTQCPTAVPTLPCTKWVKSD